MNCMSNSLENKQLSEEEKNKYYTRNINRVFIT